MYSIEADSTTLEMLDKVMEDMCRWVSYSINGGGGGGGGDKATLYSEWIYAHLNFQFAVDESVSWLVQVIASFSFAFTPSIDCECKERESGLHQPAHGLIHSKTGNSNGA